jgi:uracil-DNA glycosylase
MITSINLQEVKSKLVSKLEGTGWDKMLRTYFLGEDLDKILKILLRESQDSKRFTPQVKYIFAALEKCHFDDVRVVIIGQDPYPQIGVADGLAFSCSLKDKPEVSLKYMTDSIKKTVAEEDQDPNPTPDLERWSKQGVLLLNTAFTTTIGKPGTHQLLWKNTFVNILDSIIWNRQDVVYVFLGKKAQEYADLVPDNNLKLFASHPASAGYSGEKEWNCEDIWNKINKYLQQNDQRKIHW